MKLPFFIWKLRKFPKRPVRNDFFSVQSSETEKHQKNKSCENKFEGYNDFDSRSLNRGSESKKLKQGQGHSDGVGVKDNIINDTDCNRYTPILATQSP